MRWSPSGSDAACATEVSAEEAANCVGPPKQQLKSEISLAIACPMANEGEGAPRFVTALLKHCEGFRSVRFFAVVDKASTDNTLELLQRLARREPRLTVVWAPENRCVVDAYLRGYREALASGADWILEIDAGFTHLPEEAPALFDQMLKGYDCVFGSRFIRGGGIRDCSAWRRFISQGGTYLTKALIDTPLSDMTSGFELFSREALRAALEKGVESRGPFFQTEIKVYCRRLRICEVPIHYQKASRSVGSEPIMESFRQLWRLCKQVRAGLI